MGHLTRLAPLAALLAGLSVTSLAHAADMPMPPGIEAAPQAVTEFGSGWYLRGDMTYSWTGNPGGELVDPRTFDSSSLRDNWGFGLGIGYKHGWLRSDLTVDYRRTSAFNGYVFIPTAALDPQGAGCDTFSPTFVDIACDVNVAGRIDSFATLWNFYADLGTWNGFTPYVGAGIGGALVRTKGFNTTITALGVTPVPDPATGTYPDKDRWNLAWALMAGFSYNFAYNTALDVGYRYINIGKAETGFTTATDGNQVRTGKIDSHELRVGLRYMID
jgi:opacity protein-like surface antigen